MFSAFSLQHKAILLALIGYSCFSFADATAKWLSQTYSIYQTVAMEQLCAAGLMLLFAKQLGGIRSLYDASARKHAKIHILRSLANTAINFLIVYAFTQLPIATVYTAIFAKPYIAALIGAALFAQAIGFHRIIAITIGFAGVLVAFQPWSQSFPLPMILVLAALPFIITIMFMSTRWITDGSLLAIGFWPTFTSGAVNAALAFNSLDGVDPYNMAIILFGAAAILCGVITVSKAFQIGDGAAVSPMIYIEMIWGIILGYLIFSDVPSLWMLIGIVIIIASGIYLIYRENKTTTTKTT